jgi:hypothetical protein
MSDADINDETKNDIEFLNDFNKLIKKKEIERKNYRLARHLNGMSAPCN